MPTPLDLLSPFGGATVRAFVVETSDGAIALRFEGGLTLHLHITPESACDLAFALGQAGGMCEAGGHVRGSHAEMVDDVRGDRVVGRDVVGCRACVQHAEKDAAE